MKFSLTTFLLVISTFTLMAQQGSWGGKKSAGITGKITGTLVDSLTGRPIDFASIVLLNPKAEERKEVDGTVTDEKGNFKFPEVQLGTYDLHMSFLGYETKVVKGVTLKPRRPDVDLEALQLTPTATTLETITVEGEAALIENKVDRIVYNADQDVNTSGDATDILRKVPLLSVDLDGNVSLRGSQNIQILINGKPSGMFSRNVADALKMFPAEQIKSVEVITAPSAKYDGEGSAGIINIVTKKKRIDGFAGNLNVSAGTRHNVGSLGLNLARGRFGLSGGGHSVWSPPRDAIWDFDRTDELEDGQIRKLEQDAENSTERLGNRYRFGAYYDINAFNSINSNFSLNGAGFDRASNVKSLLTDPEGGQDEISQRDNTSETLNSGFDWNTDFTRTFPDSEREFSVGVQLSGNVDNADNTLLQTGNFDYLNIDERSDNESRNLETTVQVDYVHPFAEGVKLETGGKGIMRSIDSDFYFEGLDFATGQYERDPTRSDEFDYQQDVFAGYASLNVSFAKKFALIAGARYERTEIDGVFKVEDDKAFQHDYTNILPSVILSYKTGQFSQLRATYGQRIQRPSLRFINPFVNQQDRNNISFGNPELDPELSHNFELGYNTYVKGIVLNGALYFRHTTDVIESLLSIDPEGISATTYQNVGVDNSLGFSFFGSATIKEIWSIRGNFDIRRKHLDSELNGLDVTNTGYEFNSNVGSSVRFGKGWEAQLWGMFRNPRVTLQGTRATFWMYSISARKQVFGKRGSIGINVSNLFHRALNFDTRLEGETFTQTSLYEYPFRSYGINFNYRFGKLDFKGGERKSKVKNDDQKEGDNGNF